MKWLELTSDDFAGAIEKSQGVAMIPIGSLERHGPHLPVGCDTLTVQWMDSDAKKRAVEARKIKGKIEKDRDGNTRVHFTDTTENLAKFVAAAGDDLFSKDVLRLERVK